MSTKHSKAAEKFLQDSKMAAWHNETLWMVRAKRDKMSKEVPEWEELRNKACELKLYSNSHLEELLLEFEKNATANGAIVHWAKDADEYCAIVYEILNEHNVHHFIKSKSMLAEECGLNPFLMERGIDVVESDLGERILQLMHLEPSHIVLPAIHIKREQVGELFEKEMGTEKGNFDPTYLTHAARKNLRHLFLNAEAAMTGANRAAHTAPCGAANIPPSGAAKPWTAPSPALASASPLHKLARAMSVRAVRSWPSRQTSGNARAARGNPAAHQASGIGLARRHT